VSHKTLIREHVPAESGGFMDQMTPQLHRMLQKPNIGDEIFIIDRTNGREVRNFITYCSSKYSIDSHIGDIPVGY
jgi:hypothetical protein